MSTPYMHRNGWPFRLKGITDDFVPERIYEGLCPHCSGLLERRQSTGSVFHAVVEIGWCVACDDGWRAGTGFWERYIQGPYGGIGCITRSQVIDPNLERALIDFERGNEGGTMTPDQALTVLEAAIPADPDDHGPVAVPSDALRAVVAGFVRPGYAWRIEPLAKTWFPE